MAQIADKSGRGKLWIWLGVPLLLFGIVGTVAVVRIDAFLNRYKQKLVPKMTAFLGRPVTLGHISTTWLTGFGAEVDKAAIGGDPQSQVEKEPILEVKEVRVEIKLIPTLLSLGKKVPIKEVVIDGLTINVIRYPDGTLNIDRLLENIEKNKDTSPEPMDEETREYIRGLNVARFAMKDARMRFTDLERTGGQGGAATLEISQVDLDVRDVSVHKPFTAKLSAAILASKPNFMLNTGFGKTPRDLETGPPIMGVQLKMDRTDLSPLAPFLASRVPGLMAATAAANVNAQLGAASPGGTGPTVIAGSVELNGLRFKEGIKPFDLNAFVDLKADAAKGDVDLKKLNVRAADMGIDGHGRLYALRSSPRFEDFIIESKGINFDKVRALYPALDQTAGAKLGGPMSLRIAGSGNQNKQTFDLRVDLTGASIAKGDVFLKPAGTPFHFTAGGEAQADALLIQSLVLQIADLALKGNGTVRNFAHPSFNVKAQARTSDLTGVARLSPKVAASLPPTQKVDGTLSVDAKARGTAKASQTDARIEIAGANLKTTEVSLLGYAKAAIQSEMRETKKNEMSSTAKIDADLTRLEVHYGNDFNKAAGTPMLLNASTKGAETATSKKTDTMFELKLASLMASGRAAIEGEQFPKIDTALKVKNFDVAQMKSMLPKLAEADLPPMRIGGDFTAKGQVGRPESMHFEIKQMDVHSGKSDMSGRLTVSHLLQPSFNLQASSNYLDLDDFLPKTSEKEEKKGDRGPLKAARGTALLSVKRGEAAGLEYNDLKCELAVSNGRATAKTMVVKALGGSFSGSGTELDIVDEHGPFHVVGKASDIDLDAVTDFLMNAKGIVKGRFSGQSDLRGVGTTLAEIRGDLDGTLKGQLQEAAFIPGNLSESLLKPLSARLGFLKTAKIDPAAMAANNLPVVQTKPIDVTIVIKNGAIEFANPLGLVSALGPLSLGGKTFLNGKLDLLGTLQMPAEQASKLVGNSVKLNQPLPVKLNIGGTLFKPVIKPGELDSVAKVYLTAYAKTAAASALGQKADKLLKGSALGKVVDKVGPLPTSKAEAEAAAKKAADNAKRQAEEKVKAEQARLQTEAQAKADSAKREAEERARQAADKARKESEEKLKKEGKSRIKDLFGK